MAKVGYIFLATADEQYTRDKEWMHQYGCVQVVEEESAQEKDRPLWKQLLNNLDRGDELVISKFSNALRGVRELATFAEFCRIKVIRIISIQDAFDSNDILFPETKPSDVLRMIGSMPEECAVLRKAAAHIIQLQHNIVPLKNHSNKALVKQEREKIIVKMYLENHSIDEIFAVSGFSSRSSVFRILNKHNITLNRGPHRGPLGKRNQEE